MALFQIRKYSKCLKRTISFLIIIPNDLTEEKKCNNPYYLKNTKTLYLLHGIECDSYEWLLRSPIYELSQKYNLAIVLPAGENSFYIDHNSVDEKYSQFISEEIWGYVNQTFNISLKREDTFIGGFSMGGFGAIYNGFKYCQNFSKIIALAPALNLDDFNTSGYSCFKDNCNDFDEVIQSALDENKELPKLFIVCGNEDVLINSNREFVKFLKDKNIECEYEESRGGHHFDFWNKYIGSMIKWLIGEDNYEME